MRYESEKSEIARLRREQAQARQDEIFGGLSPAERYAYERTRDHIHELERRVSEMDSEIDSRRRA